MALNALTALLMVHHILLVRQLQTKHFNQLTGKQSSFLKKQKLLSLLLTIEPHQVDMSCLPGFIAGLSSEGDSFLTKIQVLLLTSETNPCTTTVLAMNELASL